MSDSNIEKDQSDSILAPQPLHRRASSSYGEKFERPKGRASDDLLPPSPIKTPSIDDTTPSKPYLARSHTSHYESELKNRNTKDPDIPILTNAVSLSEAYHLQHRSSSPEESLNPSMDNVSDNPFARNMHPDRHSGLLSHPPSGSEDEYTTNSNGIVERDSRVDQSTGNANVQALDKEDNVINDVNQFKRKLSWWSKGKNE